MRRLLVDVDGAPVEVGGMRVEGSPSAEQLRGSLATLGLDDVDERVRAAHAAFVAAVRGARGPANAARRVLAALHAVATWRYASAFLALAAVGAAIVLFGAPIWLGARPSDDLRGELDASALWTGASAVLLMIAIATLAAEELAEAKAANAATMQPRRTKGTPTRDGIGTGGVVAMIVLLLWLVLVTVLLIVRTSVLGGWSVPVVAGTVLHVVALAVWLPLLVVLRRGRGIRLPVHIASPLDDLPEARLAALERTYRARIEALDEGTWTAMRSAMRSHVDRLLAAGAIDAATRATTVRIGPLGDRFDAALAARLAHDPAGAVVLRPHVPLPVVAAILRGRPHSAGLVRRVVAAVAGDRQERGAPFDAAVLVDLVAAARVPVLARDTRGLAALSRAWPGLIVGAWIWSVAAVVATLLWLPSASDFRTPTSPTAAAACATLAVIMLVAAELRERLAGLRALPTTIAWMGVAAGAALAAHLVDGANAYSPYLRSLRSGEVIGLVAIALVALAAAGWRIAEALLGRRHDAVHLNSSEWPLSRARVADVEAHRRRMAGAKGAVLDDVAAEVEAALRLAADLGRLDVRVADSVATAKRRATWPECQEPISGSSSR